MWSFYQEDKMKHSKTAIMLILCTSLLWACTGDKEKESEPGKIDTMTKEIGQEAVRTIKTPIDKAQAVADKEAQRAREMEERKQQGE